MTIYDITFSAPTVILIPRKDYTDTIGIINLTPKQKKHGPEIKGRGGKVKRW